MTRRALSPFEIRDAFKLSTRLYELNLWLTEGSPMFTPPTVKMAVLGRTVDIEIPRDLVRQAFQAEHDRIAAKLAEMGIEVDFDGGCP